MPVLTAQLESRPRSISFSASGTRIAEIAACNLGNIFHCLIDVSMFHCLMDVSRESNPIQEDSETHLT
jgi:hypothetical protein